MLYLDAVQIATPPTITVLLWIRGLFGVIHSDCGFVSLVIHERKLHQAYPDTARR